MKNKEDEQDILDTYKELEATIVEYVKLCKQHNVTAADLAKFKKEQYPNGLDKRGSAIGALLGLYLIVTKKV